MESGPTEHNVNNDLDDLEECDLDDLEEYFRLRQREIESKDFAEKCRLGLEKNRGPIPLLTKK